MGDGVYISGGSNNTVTGNNAVAALSYDGSDPSSSISNTCCDSSQVYRVMIHDSNNNTVVNNVAGAAINVWYANGNLVSGNAASAGIFIGGGRADFNGASPHSQPCATR